MKLPRCCNYLSVDKSEVMKSLIKPAITKAMNAYRKNILKDFFTEYRKEIIEVGVLEYSYEQHIQVIKDESYDNGYNNGYNSGYNSGEKNGEKNGIKNTTDLFSWLKSNGREADVLLAVDDSNYLSQLFTEYEEWKKSNTTNS